MSVTGFGGIFGQPLMPDYPIPGGLLPLPSERTIRYIPPATTPILTSTKTPTTAPTILRLAAAARPAAPVAPGVPYTPTPPGVPHPIPETRLPPGWRPPTTPDTVDLATMIRVRQVLPFIPKEPVCYSGDIRVPCTYPGSKLSRLPEHQLQNTGFTDTMMETIQKQAQYIVPLPTSPFSPVPRLPLPQVKPYRPLPFVPPPIPRPTGPRPGEAEPPVTEEGISENVLQEQTAPVPGVAEAQAAMDCLAQGMIFDPMSGQCLLVGPQPSSPPGTAPAAEAEEETDYKKILIYGGITGAVVVTAALVLTMRNK